MAQAMGFYTDTTVCIGCKACQVACHQWNGLPAELAEQPSATRPGKSLPITGNSYDNTGSFSDVNWRHVKFIEKSERPDRGDLAWLMMSDVCKHCVNAPCLEVCPTGAIIRTEFDSVYIQSTACNGCRACVSACPFGVIHMGGAENAGQGTAKKCTLCYDRLQNGLQPACAAACPTESIQFGPIDGTQGAGAEARGRPPGQRADARPSSTGLTSAFWVGSTRFTCWWMSRRPMAYHATRSCHRAPCEPHRW